MKKSAIFIALLFVVSTGKTKPVRLGLDGNDYMVLHAKAPDFSGLSKSQRLFAFRLYKVVRDGDDMLYLQNNAQGLRIRQLLQTLLDYGKDLDPYTIRGLVDYLAYVVLNHGNYERSTGRKIIPNYLTAGMLRQAMANIMARGVRLDFIPGSTAEQKFQFLFPYIFDYRFLPYLVAKGSQYPIRDSAVGIYDPSITMAGINRLPESDRSCSVCRFTGTDNSIVVQRMGVNGAYARYASAMKQDLEQAFLFCPQDEQKPAIKALIDFLSSGKESFFNQFWGYWTMYRPQVDFVAGPIERQKDPRGIVGFYAGALWQRRDSSTVKGLIDSAKYFESRMPWDKRFINPDVGNTRPETADCVVGTGEMGPLPMAKFTLPAEGLRAKGVKTVLFLNILFADDPLADKAAVEEFYLHAYKKAVKRYGKQAKKIFIYMKEAIGYGSGRPDPNLQGDVRTMLGKLYKPLQATKADLVALYQVFDPVIASIAGIHPRAVKPLSRVALVQFLTNALIMQRKLGNKIMITPDQRARLLILNYMTGNKDTGVTLERQGPDYFVKVSDFRQVRTGLGRMLAKVQMILGTGDKTAGQAFLAKYGDYNHGVRDNIAVRARRIRLPKHLALIFPDLVPVMQGGVITDVRIQYPDFTDLLFRGYRTGHAPAWLKDRLGPDLERMGPGSLQTGGTK